VSGCWRNLPRPLNIKYLKIKRGLVGYISEVQNFGGNVFCTKQNQLLLKFVGRSSECAGCH
jgi:hypothetical protein